MFLANVLVGRSTNGDTSMARPPPLPPHLQSTNRQHDLYDSTVDNVLQPTIYVVYEMEKYYPAYLIMYKSKDELVKWKTYRNKDSFEPDQEYLEYLLSPRPAPRLNLPPNVSPTTQNHGASSSSASLPSSVIPQRVRTGQATAPVQMRAVPPKPAPAPSQTAQPTQAIGTRPGSMRSRISSTTSTDDLLDWRDASRGVRSRASDVYTSQATQPTQATGTRAISTRGRISPASSIDSLIDRQVHNLDQELNRHRAARRVARVAHSTSATDPSSRQSTSPRMPGSGQPVTRLPPVLGKERSCNIQ